MSDNIWHISVKRELKIGQIDQQKLFNPLGMRCKGSVSEVDISQYNLRTITDVSMATNGILFIAGSNLDKKPCVVAIENEEMKYYISMAAAIEQLRPMAGGVMAARGWNFVTTIKDGRAANCVPLDVQRCWLYSNTESE